MTQQTKTIKDMTKLTVTIPTGKAGRVAFFTIQFSVQKFDEVVDAVGLIKNEADLRNSTLWIVL